MTDRRSRRMQAMDRPGQLGLLAFLREVERSAPDRPRIGRATRLAEETVSLRQDPHMSFPESEVQEVASLPNGRIEVVSAAFGFFGPQGPLPLHLTVDLMREADGSGPAPYARFAQMLGARFGQLLFRAWSDARAITQYDHPGDDRFQTYLGAFMGLASPALRHKAAEAGFGVSTLPLSAVIGARVRSPVRLQQIVEHLLKMPFTVEENVPMWLSFEPEDQNRLGERGVTLGSDCLLGSRSMSVNDCIRLHVDCPDLATYRAFMPGNAGFRQVLAVCDVMLGVETAVELVPGLPADAVPAAALDGQAALGWTAWMDPPPAAPGAWRRDAEFEMHPATMAGTGV
jgi:type VI secretion system protein ImpH